MLLLYEYNIVTSTSLFIQVTEFVKAKKTVQNSKQFISSDAKALKAYRSH